ncbi:S-adenosyl-L-methionine-dependent methyltransferase [Lophiotrema nucula]|uniref:S-adenosyl-L-methionine-dependent methyltransferase n=1 Tax=Lophiotrema nucula TaxID=690887 RepID=A0A6A5ZJV6_9PLEO|nr:S-adenosyl-L-methionine-dependent methyltransferase [Lophiotrema nucula]
MASSSSERGSDYEATHVHAVYEDIASHFSSTRYKPWPIVDRFLKALPDGSIGADIGCGNGKYLAVNPHVFIVGSDRSSNLIKIARQHHPHAAIVADNLSLPHPQHSLDFAISIAVIHHLSTPGRRVEAVKCVLEVLRRPSSEEAQDGGKALIYVWALEQKESRRGWDEGHEQDVMVPWVMKGGGEKRKEKGQRKKGNEALTERQEPAEQPKDKTFLRYYHLYRKGELEHDIEEAGGTVVEAGYEKDNWWAVATLK